MSWLKEALRHLSGRAAREKAAEQEALEDAARRIIAEHEARSHFSASAVMEDLLERVPPEVAQAQWSHHFVSKIKPLIDAALEDGLLSPEEDQRISSALIRYGNPPLGPETQRKLNAARLQFSAWTAPLEPVDAPLLLRRGEWCVHGIQAVAYEERQRTTRIDYAGPTARIKIMKGVYYRVGSAHVSRKTEAYSHSFGEGILCVTNLRLIWMAPNKTISIPLIKIVMFEPFSDGIKIFKDTGKPLLFVFSSGEDQPAMVRISRAINELR